MSTPMAETTSAPSLRELSEAAPKGPWTVRPQRYDDWGWVRGPLREDGFRPVIFVAKGDDDEAEQSAARAEDRQPRQTEAISAFLCRLENDYRAGRLIDPTTLTEAVAAARAETEAMATMLADCVAVLQQVPLNQLPGKVDMMLFAALDAPIQGDASRSQLAERAAAIRDARDVAARAECVREALERAADEVEMIAQSWEGDGRSYAMTVAAILRIEEQTDVPPADEETTHLVNRAWERFKAGITPPTTPGGRTDG